MQKASRNCFLLILFCFFPGRKECFNSASAKEGRILIQAGMNYLYMRPTSDSISAGYKMKTPGLYLKISGEKFLNSVNFTHVELAIAYNKGVILNGNVRTSRLNYNYGFGKDFGRVKCSVSPGFCYVSVAYFNDITNRSYAESRFSLALGLQCDLVILKSAEQYLGIFTEFSMMVNKPSKWVNQLGFGISWKPVFRKKKSLPFNPF